MRHVNIPVFIPHLGCPNQCVFCNQRKISGVKEFSIDEVKDIIDRALTTVSVDDEVEIAFFGGSFTGIERDTMISLLEIAHSYIELGRVKSIRCSTRPDYINEEVLSILKRYGVKTIELGLQSSSDKVLEITKRGHCFEAEEKSCAMIVEIPRECTSPSPAKSPAMAGVGNVPASYRSGGSSGISPESEKTPLPPCKSGVSVTPSPKISAPQP